MRVSSKIFVPKLNKRLVSYLRVILSFGIISLTLWIYISYNSNKLISTCNRKRPAMEKKNSIDPTKIIRPPKNFLVWNDRCHMANVDPFTVDAVKIFKPKNYKNCSKADVPRLTQTIFDHNSRRYFLQINTSPQLLEANVTCCYKKFLRENDSTIKLLSCIDFQQNFSIPIDIDGVIVDCKSGNNDEIIQTDGHFFIHDKKITRRMKSGNNKRALSVLLLGIDSLSRFNLRRNMPKTVEWLKRTNWIEMAGYNKVGENTFPNLMALLTGYNLTDAEAECQPKKVGGLDECPFIWKNYQEQGYVTAYGEDITWMSTFKYLKKGFKNPPVDYYLQPFMSAIEKTFKSKEGSYEDCFGFKYLSEYVLDYALEFTSRHIDDPFFGLFWLNSFSHDSFDTSSAFDERILSYFEELEVRGILDVSIVIFLSDHGMRWGELRKLPQGFLEERLPLFFIHIPIWFRQRHPEIVYSLEVNRNRLTNPYDVHNTLQHILELSTSIKVEKSGSEGCPNCQTLFREVPHNRSCSDIAISDHWCTCNSLLPLDTSSFSSEYIANAVIDHINEFVQSQSYRERCEKLQLQSVVSANRLSISGSNATNHYEVKFKASPRNPLFEALVTYNSTTGKVDFGDMTSVNRLNLYASDSWCVDDLAAKQFCICVGEAVNLLVS